MSKSDGQKAMTPEEAARQQEAVEALEKLAAHLGDLRQRTGDVFGRLGQAAGASVESVKKLPAEEQTPPRAVGELVAQVCQSGFYEAAAELSARQGRLLDAMPEVRRSLKNRGLKSYGELDADGRQALREHCELVLRGLVGPKE